MNKRCRLFLLIVFSPALLMAGFPKVGTTAAPFLKIGVGARAIALGGNFTALANDVTALYWNPAGITHLSSAAFSATHTNWFAGITHDAVQLAAPLGENAALGVDFIYLSSGDIEQTTFEEQDGNGIYYNVTDLALGLTYSRRLTDRFSVGIKAKYIRQTIFNEEATTVAFDFGTIYQTDFYGLRIGMNMANFGGSMTMTGDDLLVLNNDPVTGDPVETHLKTESWPLPIVFRLGLAIDLMGGTETLLPSEYHRLTLAVDGVHPNDNNETVGAGLEYMWNDFLALRLGYQHNRDVQDFSFGGGLQFRLSGIRFTVDYAYAAFGDLDTVQRFSAGMEL